MKISVVGLPLAIQFARANVPVLGLVVDAAKVELINQGHSYIRHIPQETIEEIAKDNRLSASTDFSLIKEVEAVIICVPTPLSKNREPDISFILETGRAIAPHLVKGTVADWAQSIVDTRNAMASVKVAPGKVWKA